MERKDRSLFLWPLASLVSFNKRATSLRLLPTPVLSPLHQTSRAPDDQMVCINSLHFDFATRLLDDEEDLSPAWQVVGRHMYWTRTLQELGANYTRQTLGIEAGRRIPPVRVFHYIRMRYADAT
jgi:hypothetical protein